MNAKELRTKSVDELKNELLELSKEQASLRMQKRSGENAPKPHVHKQARRTIARLLTILHERNEK